MNAVVVSPDDRPQAHGRQRPMPLLSRGGFRVGRPHGSGCGDPPRGRMAGAGCLLWSHAEHRSLSVTFPETGRHLADWGALRFLWWVLHSFLVKYCAWKTRIYGQHSSHKQSDCTLWKNYLVMTWGEVAMVTPRPHPCGPSTLPTWKWAVRYPVDMWLQRQRHLISLFPAGNLRECGRHLCECALATCHMRSHGGALDVTPGGAGPAPLRRTPPPPGRL